MRNRLVGFLGCCFLVFFLAACGGSGGTDTGSGSGTDSPIITSSSTLSEVTELETITQANGITVEAAKDEVLLILRNDTSNAQLKDIKSTIEDHGGSIAGSDLDLMVVQVRTTKELSMIEALKSMPGVLGASLNKVCVEEGLTNDQGAALARSMQATVRPLVAAAAEAETETAVEFDGSWWMDAIKIRDAWNTTTGNSAVKIGIVDTGLKKGQKILADSRLVLIDHAGNKIDDDDTDELEKGHHGLWVTGFAAGFMDDPDNYSNKATGKNVRGVNHKSTVVDVDVKRIGSDGKTVETHVLQGIKTAIAQDAKIVNVSWGAVTEDCKDNTACKLEAQQMWRLSKIGALETARMKKALVVFAAGNDAVKNDHELFANADDELSSLWKSHAIVVGASSTKSHWYLLWLDEYLADASFSRMGDVVDLLAPGEKVGFSQGGVDVIETSHTGKGTSYAAPLVTGVGSLLLSINDTLLPSETKHFLTSTAKEVVETDHRPKKHLDASAAVESVKILEKASLDTRPQVEFTEKGQQKTVSLEVKVPSSGLTAMDVMFLIDVSGSYSDDIATMQAQASAILASLAGKGIDVQFGVASFCDFPIDPYGGTGDNAFLMRQTLTPDQNKVLNAINGLTIEYGNDAPEAQYEGLYQTAVSSGWREGALHIIVLSTDASFHDSATESGYPGKSSTQALAALAGKDIRVVGLDTGNTGGDLEDVVTRTGGQLFQLASDSSGIVTAMTQMLQNATASFTVEYQTLGGDEFIETFTPASGFVDVAKGETVAFSVKLKNPKAASDNKEQKYDVVMWVKANGSVIQRIRIPIYIAKLVK